MKNDSVCFNGILLPSSDVLNDPARALGSFFLYQKIHAYNHYPLNAGKHIEILSVSYREMTGTDLCYNANDLIRDTHELLAANRYPMGSQILALYIVPGNIDSPPGKLLVCGKQTVFPGYSHWQRGCQALALKYTLPWSKHKTSFSLSAHTYAKIKAKMNAADFALTLSEENIVVSAGENPFFAVSENRIYTPPLSAGLPDSVERQLCLKAAELSMTPVIETPFTEHDLTEFDELFTVTPEGIENIGRYANKMFSYSKASVLIEQFNTIMLKE